MAAGTVFEVTDSGFVPGTWAAPPLKAPKHRMPEHRHGQASLWELSGDTRVGGGKVTSNLGARLGCCCDGRFQRRQEVRT